MPFLRNAWYAACWDEDLQDTPVARTMLNEPIVLYRSGDGSAVALQDMCPHRFAPLSLGKVDGDRLQCPYHGLVFDREGTCVHNPNGRGATPSALAVRSYPLRLSDGMIWIWFGERERAAESEPPRYPFLVEDGWKAVRGLLHVKANYELVTDNLLDLSHAEFLHPFIAGPGDYTEINYRAEQVEERVTAYHTMPGHDTTPLFKLFFDSSVTKITGRAHLHWEAPANMTLDVGATAEDGGTADDVSLPQAHLLTPETESSTHYFWALARNRVVQNAEMDELLRSGVSHAFEHEDEPMIRAVAKNMRGRGLFEMSPALLPQDEASVRARRVLQRKIAAEAASAAK